MATNRGQYIANDQLEAINYSHSNDHYTVIINGGSALPQPPVGSRCSIIPCTTHPDVRLSGFMSYEGILWALEQGMDFERVLVIDDDALPIGKSLDIWVAGQMDPTGVDLFGVADRVNYQPWWDGYRTLMDEWVGVPDKFYPSAETIFFAANWMSRRLVNAMVEKNLLKPPMLERWNLHPDVYISWVTQLLGLTYRAHGSMEKPQLPIYANHPKHHQRWAPAPMLLHPDFKLYHSVRATTSDELEIREHYRHVRNPA